MILYDLTLSELVDLFAKQSWPKYRANQVWEWLYDKKVTEFSDMHNIPKEIIDYLSTNYALNPFTVLMTNQSIDGTIKFLFELSDKNVIETVLMNHHYGNSICITTQVGCNMGCSFCASGIIKKKRDLMAGEIVAQIIWAEKIAQIKIHSVVVMGIGEPFDNFTNLTKFIEIVNHPKGLKIGARHITVSTCGIVPKIIEFANLGVQVNLALSLHAPNDEIRSRLMVINKSFGIAKVMDAIKEYIKITNRRVTIEYILIDQINDLEKCAVELARLLKGLNVYVNLIPYNPVIEVSYRRSTKEQQLLFYDILKKNHIQVTLRKETGSDINAACGQLRSNFVKAKS